jgi:hypothetical protein
MFLLYYLLFSVVISGLTGVVATIRGTKALPEQCPVTATHQNTSSPLAEHLLSRQQICFETVTVEPLSGWDRSVKRAVSA